jgi:hypothetical protein
VQPHVTLAADGAGFMLVDLLTEQYYTLNEIGGRVWRLIADGESLDAVVATITEAYGVDETVCRADVEALALKLTTWGLIT